jgi:hypothetical protein
MADSAEGAMPGAMGPQDQKGRRFPGKAFPHVGTHGRFADGMQSSRTKKPLDFVRLFALTAPICHPFREPLNTHGDPILPSDGLATRDLFLPSLRLPGSILPFNPA